MPLVLPFPDIDPVIFAFHLFGIELAIRWYALAYIAGLLLGWRYVVGALPPAGALGRDGADAAGAGRRPSDLDDPGRDPRRAARLCALLPAGLLCGQPGPRSSRSGRAACRSTAAFSAWSPGVIGFSLKNGFAILGVGDAVSAAAPIGLFFGRIANFINGELWGRPSTAPWAVIFPGEAAQAARPTGSAPARGTPRSSTRRRSKACCSLSSSRWRSGPGRSRGRAASSASSSSATRWRGSSSRTSARPTPSSSPRTIRTAMCCIGRADHGPALVAADAGRWASSCSHRRGRRARALTGARGAALAR